MYKKIFAVLAGGVLALGSLTSQPAESREMCTDLVVSGSYAYVKAGAGLNTRTLRTARRGEALTMTGTQPRGGWNEVTTSNGTKGWVHDSVIRCRSGVVAKMSCTQVRISGPRGAYMKAQPWMSSKTFRTAPRGEVLNLESPGSPIEYNGWYLLRSGTGTKGWAHNSVLACK